MELQACLLLLLMVTVVLVRLLRSELQLVVVWVLVTAG
jgi:hypothetical protein